MTTTPHPDWVVSTTDRPSVKWVIPRSLPLPDTTSFIVSGSSTLLESWVFDANIKAEIPIYRESSAMQPQEPKDNTSQIAEYLSSLSEEELGWLILAEQSLANTWGEEDDIWDEIL